MKAQIQPLKGKYYGTIIELVDGPLAGNEINLWFASGEPSRRELEAQGYTVEQWQQNALVDYGDCGKVPIRKADVVCDSHYECAETLRVAEAFIAALEQKPINTMKPPDTDNQPPKPETAGSPAVHGSPCRDIGKIGNYYGGLSVKMEDGKCYWGIENYAGTNWDEIPRSLFDALNTYQDSEANESAQTPDGPQ